MGKNNDCICDSNNKEKEDFDYLQRVAQKEETAVKDSNDAYGNLIWALAGKFTTSTEEADAATREIFIDIWRYSGRTDKTQSAEEKLIALIALRRLIRSL